MTNYRYQLISHNGVACVRVLIEQVPDQETAEAYIPLADLQTSINRERRAEQQRMRRLRKAAQTQKEPS